MPHNDNADAQTMDWAEVRRSLGPGLSYEDEAERYPQEARQPSLRETILHHIRAWWERAVRS